MIKFVCKLNNYMIYEDNFMEDDKIIKGRKGSDDNNNIAHHFLVTNYKTITKIKLLYQKQKREEKLKRILNDK